MTAARHEWTPDDHDLTIVARDGQPIDGDRDAARVVTRVQHAAALRLQRLSWEEVAQRVGYSSRSAAFTAVMGYLRRQTAETVADLREQESAAIDRAAVAIFPKVLAGDARAHDTWLRNRQRYARLHGLDAPVQVAISVGVAAEVDDALAELEEFMGTVVPGRVLSSVADDPDEEERHG